MRDAEINLHFVTPAFLSGADQAKAEFRAPSVRGMVRWWTRALGYSSGEEILWFGSAEKEKGFQKSELVIRDTTDHPLSVISPASRKGLFPSYFLWPCEQRRKGMPPLYSRMCLAENSRVSFSLRMRRKECAGFPEEILKSFLLLGSLGSRSRRCYGSLWPDRVVIDGKEWKIPDTLYAFREELERILTSRSNMRILALSEPKENLAAAILESMDFLKRYRCGSRKSGEPSDWGKSDHDAIFNSKIREVYRQALGLPLVQRYSDGDNVISCVEGCDRLASPLHLKVIPLKEGFVPLGIIFYSHLLKDGTPVKLRSRKRGVLEKVLNNELLVDYMAVDEYTETLGDFRP